jgi:hypothetical protein
LILGVRHTWSSCRCCLSQDTIETGRRLDPPQISDSIVDEIIPELKLFSLQCVGQPNYSDIPPVQAWACQLLRTRFPRLEPKTITSNRVA